MSAPASTPDLVPTRCPHCRAELTIAIEDLGRTLECPSCHQPFESSLPPPVTVRPSRVFQFKCLRCFSVLQAVAEQSGKGGKCPSCGATFTVPQFDPRTGLARTDADPGDDGENPTPVHAYAAAGDMAPRIHRKPDDSLVIECPRCRKEASIRANNCEQCGLPFTLEGMTSSVATVESGGGTIVLILGITGLVLSACGGIGFFPGAMAFIAGGVLWLRDGYRTPGIVRAGTFIGALAAVLGGMVFFLL